MWFKNLRIYRLANTFPLSAEDLGEALSSNVFAPCGKLDPARYGWVPPLGRHGTDLVHVATGYIMMCSKRQEKILPSGVIKDHLEEKVLEIAEKDGRRVSRKERDGLKDEIIFSLLPKAFVKSSLDFAYIALKEKLIIVNASSAKRAEELLSALREAVGPLNCTPLTSKKAPTKVLTEWLKRGSAGRGFELGEECELQAPKDGRVIRCKNQDLTAHEVLNHIDSGMNVTKLAVSWKSAIHCVIDEELTVKRIKFDDEIIDKANDYNAETNAEEFDIEFGIMTLELSAFIEGLIKAFGGESE